MGQCKLASKVGGGSKDTKNYIFKDGVFSVTPTTNTGTSISDGKLQVTQASNVIIPYVKTGELLFVKLSYKSKTNTLSCLFVDNGSNSGTGLSYAIDTSATYYGKPVIKGLETYQSIHLYCLYPTSPFTAQVEEIWTEPAE